MLPMIYQGAKTFGLMTAEEFSNLVAISQVTPGPIAVNAAILVGMKTAGAAGMCAAVLGTIIPPMTILSVISVFYALFKDNPSVSLVLKGMQSGVAAVILDVVLTMAQKIVKTGSAVRMMTMAGAFIAVYCLNINVILIIAAAAGIGIVSALAEKRREAAK